MRNKSILILVVLIVFSFSVGRLSAGSPDPPGGPTSAAAQMYTLEQIYQRISNGGAFDFTMTTFTEPSTAPGTGTMHTLNEISNLIGASAHVPRTGQEQIFATGDDGNLQKGVRWGGVNPRFTDNSDGTVTDTLTGLIWLRNANCFGVQKWSDAMDDANNLANGQCSLTDGSVTRQWRLPNLRELLSLIDYSASSPAFPFSGSPFTNLQASVRYWSSTTVANNTPNAWNIDFDIGTVNRNQPKTLTFYVWPVRGGQTNP